MTTYEDLLQKCPKYQYYILDDRLLLTVVIQNNIGIQASLLTWEQKFRMLVTVVAKV